MQRYINRHLQVVKVLPHRAARAKLARARANDLIVNAEFRDAGAFDPMRKEVTHVLPGHLVR